MRNRLVVLLRTHIDSPKVRDSIDALARGSKYDFFVLAHEEPGAELDFGATSKLTHSLQTFRDLGFEVTGPQFLTHCADLLFAFAQSRLPDYDHYLIVEYDVFVQQREAHPFDRIAEVLAGSEAPPDFIAAYGERAEPSWMWVPATAAVYAEVAQSFFPAVILSARAIKALYEERLKEREQVRASGRPLLGDGSAADWMFCEAFTPTALKARGDFRLADWNDVLPGTYEWTSFNVGPPRLLAGHLATELPVQLVHPVLGGREFLQKGLLFSALSNTTPEWLATLRSGAWPIHETLLTEFDAAAEAHIAGMARHARVSSTAAPPC
jgi:hypothetical protein